jgi:hypothetical protein
MKYALKNFMWSIIILIYILIALLTGCSTTRVISPYEVSTIPVDCLNRASIVSWLDQQSHSSKPSIMSEEEYRAHIAAIKYKIWQVRTICQPM